MIVLHFPIAFGHSIPPVLAYIDPGILSMALQAVFVFLFGAVTAYFMVPWQWLASFFRRKSGDSTTTASEGPPERDSTNPDTQDME